MRKVHIWGDPGCSLNPIIPKKFLELKHLFETHFFTWSRCLGKNLHKLMVQFIIRYKLTLNIEM